MKRLLFCFTCLLTLSVLLHAQTPDAFDIASFNSFSTFTAFSNAWYYSPISPDNPKVELPQ